MEIIDKDLLSIQEVRNIVKHANLASKELANMSQEQIDKVVKAISDAGIEHAERLAKMASEETGFGNAEDKTIKNYFASKVVYDSIKDQKTVGIIKEDKELKTIDIAIPVGVVAGIIPSTNPTSTVIYKTLISIKGGNAIVISPHPGAKSCILETVKVIKEAAQAAGCPKDAIGVITVPTLQATQELMKHDDTKLILATGGAAMVKAAYLSGTPAIGVGAGNGPAFIDRSADIPLAIKRIVDSKTFDHGTICASEQSIVIEKDLEDQVTFELKKRGAYLLSQEESEKLGTFILRANGTMNPAIVGKSAEHLSKLAGLSRVPASTKVLVAKTESVGLDVPYSHEKLAPILALYVEDSVDGVLERSKEILEFEGMGHTFSIHANDEALVKKFALQMPASRILVNTPGALGGIGATTNLWPALTLGCGAMGGSASSNNIGPKDLINIKKVAYGIKEIEEIRSTVFGGRDSENSHDVTSSCLEQDELVDEIVKKLMERLM
ncbi:MAG TPA: acetaldehyde dehydrogenase (acetylating) [Candidatus Merdenecus merdavium]|nr:acetaldehyde dehydrogenase (acetylating) [Candidatus Merdenecus merdavium]